MSSQIKITLVCTIGCSGAAESEKNIKEVLQENKLSEKVAFEKIVYTGTEKDFDPPIHGSPTILINGVDAFAETARPALSLG